MLRKLTENAARPFFLALSSAIFLILAFPNFQISLLAWIALVPLLSAVEDAPAGKSFILSYAAGAFFFAGVLYWLAYVTKLGYIFLALYLALFFGLFGLFAAAFYKKFKNSKFGFLPCLLLPAAWALLEFLRGTLLTGFPWCILGYTQYKNPLLIQVADITGPYGVSFLIVMANVVIKEAVKPRRGFAVQASILAAALFLSAGYGYFRTNAKEIETGIKLAVAQGSIEQLKKWDPDYKNYILARYEKLTRGAAKEDVDLIIWPETALPGLLDDDEMRLYLKKIAALSDARLFSGALTCRSEPGRDIFFNSAVLFTAGGQAEKKYDKIHLVPFGEYIPFEARIPFLRGSINAEIGDCSPGAEFTTFEIKAISGEKYKYAALICFEDIFPGLARKFVLKGADFLVNITNDAWFRESGEQLQHAQASVFRAVENRVSIVRAANNGFSCFISPKGIIEDWLPGEGRGSIYAPGSKAFNLKIMRQRTFYSAYGDLFILICISIISCYFIDFSKITI